MKLTLVQKHLAFNRKSLLQGESDFLELLAVELADNCWCTEVIKNKHKRELCDNKTSILAVTPEVCGSNPIQGPEMFIRRVSAAV